MDILIRAGGGSFEGLLHVLEKGNSDESATAAFFLARLDEEAAPMALRSVAQNKDLSVHAREHAIHELGMLQDMRMLLPLLALAQDDEKADIRAAATYALGWMHDPRAVAQLTQMLLDTNAAAVVRVEAASALDFQGAEEASPALVDTLKDPDAEVRAAAIIALGHVGNLQALPELERLASTDQATVKTWRADWTNLSEGAAEAIENIKARAGQAMS